MRKILFDNNKEKELLEKGYTTTSFLSAQEVAMLLEGLGKLRPDNSFDISNNDNSLPSYHYSILDTDIEYKQKSTSLIQEIFQPNVNRIFNNYQLLTSSFFIKPPYKGFLDAHQHFPITTDFNDISVIIWCPLIDVDESNGTLQVVEGSHKITPGVFAFGYPPFFIDYCANIKKYSKPIPLKAGEAIIFDNNLIHWSTENNSSKYRFTAQALALPSEIKPVFYYFDSNSPQRFEVFEVNSKFFIEQILMELFEKPPKNLKSLGFVENKNQVLSEQTFADLLNQRVEIRSEIKVIKQEKSKKFNWLAKLYSKIKK